MPRYRNIFSAINTKKFNSLPTKTQAKRLLGSGLFLFIFAVVFFMVLIFGGIKGFEVVLIFPAFLFITSIFLLIISCVKFQKAKEEEQAQKIFEEKLAQSNIKEIDNLSGSDFELFCKLLYEKLGYVVSTTKTSGDYGVDLILYKNGIKTIGQCKRYNNKVSLSAVQEIATAKKYFNCDNAFIITNNFFTQPAKNLADANNVSLIDRTSLIELICKTKEHNQQEFVISQTQKTETLKEVSFTNDFVKKERFESKIEKLMQENKEHNDFSSFAHESKDKIVTAYQNGNYEKVKSLIDEVETKGKHSQDTLTLHFFYQDVAELLYAMRFISASAIFDCLALCDKDIELLKTMQLKGATIKTLSRKAICFEKENKIMEAISVCDFAIKHNYLDNGKPFLIRKSRLEKKLN